MSIGVALPYWLDRSDAEAVEIAQAADRAGIATVWVGEMTSFDAFALATAIGLRTEHIRLTIGPLPLSVRSPVAIALGVTSVATLTGRPVDVALGASSPAIVAGWHDRPWDHLAARMRETIAALRTLLNGERVHTDGDYVRAHGFRSREPQPGASITAAAFGPAMTRVAARHADGVVLNLVSPERVGTVRATVDREASAAGRPPPRLTVWVPVALDPGERARRQLAGQLAVYLGVPGYAEQFIDLGFGALVDRARGGARRAELAEAVPRELLGRIGAIGTASDIAARLAEYRAAGADHVAVVPSTAEDPTGRGALEAVGAAVAAAS